MLKGAQKRMIVIKTADSAIFDEAHFLLKPNFDGEEMDMVAEAEKIVRARTSAYDKKTAEGGERLVFSLLGGAVGFFLGFLLCLLFI